MGVRLYNKENMSTGESFNNTTQKINCNKQTMTSSAATTNATAAQRNNCSDGTLREIVGNYKRMRMEDNTHNLRIVGNNNHISISFNVGNIIIIGNSTKLKIKTNHGHITYTGNDGRINLGEDSTEQFVNYSGCNGILKVQNSKKSSQVNDADKVKNHPKMEKTSIQENLSDNKTPKEKYVSYRSLLSESEVFECHMNRENIFNHKKSIPKIIKKAVHCENVSNNRARQLPKTFLHNNGNIVIANSANISISPYSYSY